MEVRTIQSFEDLITIRAENPEGLEICVQKTEEEYYFEWNLDLEPQEKPEDKEVLEDSSGGVTRNSYEIEDIEYVAGCISECSDYSEKELIWELVEFGEYLHPNSQIDR